MGICGLRDRWLSEESRDRLLLEDAVYDGVAEKLAAARCDTDKFLKKAVSLTGVGDR